MKLLPSESNDYSQVAQTSDVTFAPVGIKDGELYQTHPFFRCKDYFNEIVCARRDPGEAYSQYGFSFNAHTHVTRECTEFLIKSKTVDEVLAGVDKYLHPLEDELGFSRTVLEPVDTNIMHVQGDPVWYKEPYMVSIYTYLLRVFAYAPHTANTITALLASQDETSTDGKLIHTLKSIGLDESVILTMVKNYTRIDRTDEEFKAGIEGLCHGYLHNNSGFVGMATAYKNVECPSFIKRSTNQMYPQLEEIFNVQG